MKSMTLPTEQRWNEVKTFLHRCSTSNVLNAVIILQKAIGPSFRNQILFYRLQYKLKDLWAQF